MAGDDKLKLWSFTLSIAGEDYESGNGVTLMLAAGSTVGDQQCHNITIIDDNDVETTESFAVSIESAGATVTAGSFTVVIITEDTPDSELLNDLKVFSPGGCKIFMQWTFNQ